MPARQEILDRDSSADALAVLDWVTTFGASRR